MPAELHAILFDLDGTLLDNDMDVFLPRYFELIGRRVAHIMPPREFVRLLMQATQLMVENPGEQTNEEVFAAAFYPLLGRSRAEMEPVFMEFYRDDFPSLQRYTRPLPEARQAVQLAFDRGYDVVIATNPLFPAAAIQHRLAWAGVADFPYRLITSYENSRAAKPNPAYYRDILAQLRQPASRALMVGNEWADMVAGDLGCSTFFIGDLAALAGTPAPAPTYHGRLADLMHLLAA